jgi:excisionase family DNA binding protein
MQIQTKVIDPPGRQFISIRQLAEYLGVKDSTVTRWLRRTGWESRYEQLAGGARRAVISVEAAKKLILAVRARQALNPQLGRRRGDAQKAPSPETHSPSKTRV